MPTISQHYKAGVDNSMKVQQVKKNSDVRKFAVTRQTIRFSHSTVLDAGFHWFVETTRAMTIEITSSAENFCWTSEPMILKNVCSAKLFMSFSRLKNDAFVIWILSNSSSIFQAEFR